MTYLRLQHERAPLICGFWRTTLAVCAFAATIGIPAYLGGHISGYKQGKEAGIDKCRIAIDESIATGNLFSFEDKDVRIVHVVRNKSMRKQAQESEEMYLQNVRYRAMQTIDPEDGFQVRF